MPDLILGIQRSFARLTKHQQYTLWAFLGDLMEFGSSCPTCRARETAAARQRTARATKHVANDTTASRFVTAETANKTVTATVTKRDATVTALPSDSPPTHLKLAGSSETETVLSKETSQQKQQLRKPGVDGTSLSPSLWNDIQRAVLNADSFKNDAKMLSAKYWDDELEANPEIDPETEIKRAQAWITANPNRAPKKRLARFMHSWLARAQDQARQES